MVRSHLEEAQARAHAGLGTAEYLANARAAVERDVWVVVAKDHRELALDLALAGACERVARSRRTQRLAVDVCREEAARSEHTGIERRPERNVAAQAEACDADSTGAVGMLDERVDGCLGVAIVRTQRLLCLALVARVSAGAVVRKRFGAMLFMEDAWTSNDVALACDARGEARNGRRDLPTPSALVAPTRLPTRLPGKFRPRR